MSSVKTILLVCTGNSCRSVMAAALLEKMLKGKGKYKINTAGTAAFKGTRATDEAIEVMSEEHIDVSKHLSQPLSNELVDAADLILVMERRHKEYILNHKPDARNKVHLLSEFGRPQEENKLVDPDIPDPIGRPLDFYRKVLGIIKEGVIRTIKKLEE